MAGDDEVHNLLLSPGQRPGRQRGPQVLAGLEQFRQPDIGMVRPAHDAARCLGGVVDARLLGVHVGAIHDGDACHAVSHAPDFVCGREASIDARVARAATRNAWGACVFRSRSRTQTASSFRLRQPLDLTGGTTSPATVRSSPSARWRRPLATPSRSRISRFWLIFHLPSNRVMAMRKPTMPRNMTSM